MSTPSPTADQGARARTADEVLADLRGLFIEIIGADCLPADTFTRETSFTNDLSLESIQFVVLAEEVRSRYGDVDIVGWLAGMNLDAIVALQVGDLVDLIVRAVNEPVNEPAKGDHDG